jgi:hypothetical protein
MRIIFTLFLLLLFRIVSHAQTVAINTTGNAGDSSAMLDISSAAKGLLIPRMSTAQIQAIVRPAKGLLVYDSVGAALMVNVGIPSAPDWENVIGSGGGSGWGLSGNADTHPATNFIGTTDTAALHFRVNNIQAGLVDTFGYNVALGFRTLDSVAGGQYNTAIGYKALTKGGTDNTAIGSNALRYNTTGVDNTALGMEALQMNTAGLSNVAVGSGAMQYNTTGGDNTAMGFYAMSNNTTGVGNTAIGERALLGTGNSIGKLNTAVGWNSLEENSTGSNNMAAGGGALGLNTSGSYNTASGYGSLDYDSSGWYNTALGAWANYHTTHGGNNTAIGYYSLYQDTSTGNNTAVGYNALFSNLGGTNNTAIGAGADITVGNLTNATAIGAGATVGGSNSMVLGNTAVVAVTTYGNFFTERLVYVHGNKGLVRSIDATQQKKLTTTVAVNLTIAAGGTTQVPFTFSEAFSAAPDVYVGNIISGGGFAEVIMTVAGVTTTGGTLFINNPKALAYSPNFTISIVAIGAE